GSTPSSSASDSRSRSRSRRRDSTSSVTSRDGSEGESRKRMALISEKLSSNHREVLEQKQRLKAKSKEEMRRRKEVYKALETPEEKRMRRLAKKEAKEKKRKLMSGWDEEYMGYTNADNPFGDANLHKTFVWHKKYDKMGLKNVSEEEIDRMNRQKMQMTKRELEKVKERRLEREREREMRDDEMSRMQREKEAEQFKEWEKQEDIFHLKQAKLRSKLRINENRAKPIDLLARYISAFGDDIGVDEESEKTEKTEEMATDLVEPYLCLNGLRINDLEDLFEDIKVYMTLDSQKNLEFWKDLQIIVEDELSKLKKCQTQSAVERREGINPAVTQDVVQVFKDKTPAQLQALQKSIETKIHSNEEGIDIGYWESLLSRLKAHIARARLRELHELNLNKRLNRLREEQKGHKIPQTIANEPLFPIIDTNTDIKQEEMATTSREEDDDKFEEEEAEEMDPFAKCIEDYERGQYSPKLLSTNDIELQTMVIEVEEDMRRLEEQRKGLLNVDSNEGKTKGAMSAAEQAFEKEARKGMNDDEAIFSVEEQIKEVEKQYSWSDKYRPRKPRYFNRVHTGFVTLFMLVWVMLHLLGGGFHQLFSVCGWIFYTACAENRDFAQIRFSSGPPYEDICFKIVNREWNFSYKSGFRSQFHNNILQLWFHFKRYRYRR
ncbi:unnamed protein product, partial [Oppiella nova]